MRYDDIPPPPSNPLIKSLSIALAITWIVVTLLMVSLQLYFGPDAPYRVLGFDFMQALVMSLNLVIALPMVVLTLWGIGRSERTRGRRLKWCITALLFAPLTTIVFGLGEE